VTALYPRLVGADWTTLPQVVRDVHQGDGVTRAAGRFTVHPGSTALARVLARLGGLPEPGEVALEVEVTPDADGETWHRRFGEGRLVTRQWEENGRLVEEVGRVQVVFTLAAVDGGLQFRQVGAQVACGRWRVPLPPWLAPLVRARAWEDDGLRVKVEVTAPVAGLLCAYEGVLTRDQRT
jgi:hypothetical protein